jgi:hypothetical protein
VGLSSQLAVLAALAYREETLFIIFFKLGFWLFVLAAAGMFIFALLLCATIVGIRDDRRRAARMGYASDRLPTVSHPPVCRHGCDGGTERCTEWEAFQRSGVETIGAVGRIDRSR